MSGLHRLIFLLITLLMPFLRFNTLSKEDQNILIRPIILDEVFLTTKLMPRGKNVGPNSLNIEFCLFYEEAIKDPSLF